MLLVWLFFSLIISIKIELCRLNTDGNTCSLPTNLLPRSQNINKYESVMSQYDDVVLTETQLLQIFIPGN